MAQETWTAVVQTVGAKGHDGFMIAVVTADK